jgi:hypothetical protein
MTPDWMCGVAVSMQERITLLVPQESVEDRF